MYNLNAKRIQENPGHSFSSTGTSLYCNACDKPVLSDKTSVSRHIKRDCHVKSLVKYNNVTKNRQQQVMNFFFLQIFKKKTDGVWNFILN